ncbi:BLOC-3 complex member HPS1-like isoform X4 [Oscarella lobularis]|uniref:BLOC-3 complex member HPS1-like isoform X4 n=1 Tax=Oscarella lobularis TaxID=121494 RepID=UPI0033131893
MKCFVALSSTPDVIFFDADTPFKTLIKEKAKKLGQDEQDQDEQGVNLQVVGQYFAPLFASFQVLLTAGNAYNSIKSEDGTTYVFHLFGEVTCIALCGDGDEDEDFLKRKTLAFQSFVGFFYGPVNEELKPSSVAEKNYRWKFLSKLLRQWSELTKTEQAFLTEATEQLIVKNELNAHYIKLLEESLKAISRLEDITAVHGLLLVGTRLLALFSSRAAMELNPSDILLINLVAYSTFPPPSPKLATPPPDLESRGVAFETPRPDADEIFYSPIATPVLSDPIFSGPRYSTPNVSTSGNPGSRLGSFTEADYKSISEDDQMTSADPEVENFLKGGSLPNFSSEHFSDARRQFLGRRPSLPALKEDSEDEENPEFSKKDRETFVRHKVFLKTGHCPFTPYVLHCIEIAPGIVLAVVSEIPSAQVATLICHALSFLSPLLNVIDAPMGQELGRVHVKSAMTALEDSHRRIAESARRNRKTSRIADKVRKELPLRWERLKEKGLQSFLENIVEDSSIRPMTVDPEMENATSQLVNMLHAYFKYLYFKKTKSLTDELCIEKVLAVFKDLEGDYLLAKALKNVPAIHYQQKFPGLVHFIYVDRMTNQLTAPSLDVTGGEDENAWLHQHLRKNVWRHWTNFRRLLSQGYMSASVRDSHFLYSYQLWCEDQTGSVLSWDSSSSFVRDLRPPSVISVKFYKDLLSTGYWKGQPGVAVHCYEMMCVHVGVVSTEHAAKQSKKLASRLWDESAVNSPANLL